MVNEFGQQFTGLSVFVSRTDPTVKEPQFRASLWSFVVIVFSHGNNQQSRQDEEEVFVKHGGNGLSPEEPGIKFWAKKRQKQTLGTVIRVVHRINKTGDKHMQT